jgi:hypothetical protein
MQRTRFFDAYRSYVINYNHGKTMSADADERWTRFWKMLEIRYRTPYFQKK